MSISTIAGVKNKLIPLAEGRLGKIIFINNPKGLHVGHANNVAAISRLTTDKDVYISPLSNVSDRTPMIGSVLSVLSLNGKGRSFLVDFPENYPARLYRNLVQVLQAKDDKTAAMVKKNCYDFYGLKSN